MATSAGKSFLADLANVAASFRARIRRQIARGYG